MIHLPTPAALSPQLVSSHPESHFKGKCARREAGCSNTSIPRSPSALTVGARSRCQSRPLSRIVSQIGASDPAGLASVDICAQIASWSLLPEVDGERVVRAWTKQSPRFTTEQSSSDGLRNADGNSNNITLENEINCKF